MWAPTDGGGEGDSKPEKPEDKPETKPNKETAQKLADAKQKVADKKAEIELTQVEKELAELEQMGGEKKPPLPNDFEGEKRKPFDYLAASTVSQMKQEGRWTDEYAKKYKDN